MRTQYALLKPAALTEPQFLTQFTRNGVLSSPSPSEGWAKITVRQHPLRLSPCLLGTRTHKNKTLLELESPRLLADARLALRVSPRPYTYLSFHVHMHVDIAKFKCVFLYICVSLYLKILVHVPLFLDLSVHVYLSSQVHHSSPFSMTMTMMCLSMVKCGCVMSTSQLFTTHKKKRLTTHDTNEHLIPRHVWNSRQKQITNSMGLT